MSESTAKRIEECRELAEQTCVVLFDARDGEIVQRWAKALWDLLTAYDAAATELLNGLDDQKIAHCSNINITLQEHIRAVLLLLKVRGDERDQLRGENERLLEVLAVNHRGLVKRDVEIEQLRAEVKRLQAELKPWREWHERRLRLEMLKPSAIADEE